LKYNRYIPNAFQNAKLISLLEIKKSKVKGCAIAVILFTAALHYHPALPSLTTVPSTVPTTAPSTVILIFSQKNIRIQPA
jgi:hypothetical protein